MHLSFLLSATLIALSAGAPSLDTAKEENIPALDVLVKRHNAFQRLQCGAVHIFDQAACEAVGRYRTACLLVVEVKYQNCRRRASNDIPNDNLESSAGEPSCPPACGTEVKACVKRCDASSTEAQAKACFGQCVSSPQYCIPIFRPTIIYKQFSASDKCCNINF
ncbi:unnamed protein product [Cercospora beticola]|nr:unnamed protein product [Cercospora beticola]